VHEDNIRTNREHDSNGIESSPEGCEDILGKYENANANANGDGDGDRDGDGKGDDNNNSNGNENGNVNMIVEETVGQTVEWESSAVQLDSANDNGCGALAPIDESDEAKGALASICEDEATGISGDSLCDGRSPQCVLCVLDTNCTSTQLWNLTHPRHPVQRPKHLQGQQTIEPFSSKGHSCPRSDKSESSATCMKFQRACVVNWRLNGLRRHITHNVPIGTAPVDAAVQAAWDVEEEALIGLLMLNLLTEVWKQVSNPTTYPSIFDKYTRLDTLFGSMGAMAMFNLWHTLVNTRLQEGSPFQPQFQTILNTRNTLSENGMSVSDMQLAFIILDALPPSFSAIAGTILAIGNPNALDPRMLIERILNEESHLSGPVSLNKFTPVKPRQKPRQQNATASSSSAPAPQGGVTCFYCQKPGHKAIECKKKQKDLENAKKGKAGQRKSGQTAVGQGSRTNVVATTIGGSSAAIQEVLDAPQITLYTQKAEKFVYISRDKYHNYHSTIQDNFDYQPDTDDVTNPYDELYDGYYYLLCAVRKDKLHAPKKNGWLVDSGASHHFTPDITDFDTLEDDDTEVSLGDRSLVKITQKGTVKLRVEGIDLTLTNVKYMPKCKICILSPGSLIEKGARAVFYNGGIDIFLDKRCIAQGQQIGSLYWVFMQPHLNLSVDT
jgi:hypothetical protein